MKDGPILNESGETVGEHPGANAFTVGQRKGLKLGTPAPDGKPRFVLEVRPVDNEVVVGPEHLLNIDEMRGIKVSWAGLPPSQVADAQPHAPGTSAEFECTAQVRAHGDPVPARAWVEWGADDDGTLVVRLVDPMRGVVPGQTVVIYQGTRVLGQATIDTARSLQWEQPVHAG